VGFLGVGGWGAVQLQTVQTHAQIPCRYLGVKNQAIGEIFIVATRKSTRVLEKTFGP